MEEEPKQKTLLRLLEKKDGELRSRKVEKKRVKSRGILSQAVKRCVITEQCSQ
jgi:hypothetical protein